jgi:hypothetical protein
MKKKSGNTGHHPLQPNQGKSKIAHKKAISRYFSNTTSNYNPTILTENHSNDLSDFLVLHEGVLGRTEDSPCTGIMSMGKGSRDKVTSHTLTGQDFS